MASRTTSAAGVSRVLRKYSGPGLRVGIDVVVAQRDDEVEVASPSAILARHVHGILAGRGYQLDQVVGTYFGAGIGFGFKVLSGPARR